MEINREKIMSTKTKFEEIKENLDSNYYSTQSYINASDLSQSCYVLKIALDELLNVPNEMFKE